MYLSRRLSFLWKPTGKSLICTKSRFLSSAVAGKNGGEERLFEQQRLSKIIAHSGLASRRESERMIIDGRVSLNGTVETNVSTKSNPFLDVVMVDGMRINTRHNTAPAERIRLWAVFKRVGELVADTDNTKNRPLLMQRISKFIDPAVMHSIRPVQRLDFKTEGLILMTNNSKLARLLNSEGLNLKRQFRCRVHGLLTDSKLDAIKRGPVVDGQKYAPMHCKIDRHGKSTISWLTLTLNEAKSKAINNVLAHLYIKPLRIISTAFGPYSLEKLELTEAIQVMEIKLTKELLVAYRNA